MPGFELWSDAERKEVNEVLETGILMRYGFDAARKGKWKAEELEAEICKRFGAAHAHVVSSGTAALTVAMASLGIGAGDEVIIPAFTFVASFEAVLSVGAIPVFVDVDDTLTMDPEEVKKATTSRTKCIMPVHMCGSMADLDALLSIARENNLLLLEDACQSIGASYKGKSLGTIGDAGTFSFDFVKTITCGEGGAVMTNNAGLFNKASAFSDHGHDHLGIDRGADLHPFMGYNFRISELHAAVGLAQIRRVDEFLVLQKKNHGLLKSSLSEVPGVQFRRIPDPEGDSCSFVSWFLPSEEITRQVVDELKKQGILAGNFYWFDNNWHYVKKWEHLKKIHSLYPLHPEQVQALQKLAVQDFSKSDALMSRCISTSVSLLWTPEQAEEKARKIVSVVREVLSRSKHLNN